MHIFNQGCSTYGSMAEKQPSVTFFQLPFLLKLVDVSGSGAHKTPDWAALDLQLGGVKNTTLIGKKLQRQRMGVFKCRTCVAPVAKTLHLFCLLNYLWNTAEFKQGTIKTALFITKQSSIPELAIH